MAISEGAAEGRNGRRLDLIGRLLYETPGGIRFTQDCPILTDVWLAYARRPRDQQNLILTLDRDKSAGAAAMDLRGMLARLREREAQAKYELAVPLERRKRAKISYVTGQISAELYFDELMRIVLPLTPWWRETYEALRSLQVSPDGRRGEAADWKGFPMASPGRIEDMVDGLTLLWREMEDQRGRGAAEHRRAGSLPAFRVPYIRQIPVDFLWLVRLAGLIGDAFSRRHGILDENDRLGRQLEREIGQRWHPMWAPHEEEDTAERMAPGQLQEFWHGLASAFCAIYENWSDEGGQPDEHYIWRASGRRNVELAVIDSALTVKADAARRLFDISCKGITWAVIDSGIDAAHPAFADTSAGHEAQVRQDKQRQLQQQDNQGEVAEVGVEDLRSRVRKTFDFTGLRELLDTEVLDPGENADVEMLAQQRALVEKLAERLRKPSEPEISDDHREEACLHISRLRDRIRRGRDIDWADLEPLISVQDPPRPKIDHGTHVAGILGADWIEDLDHERILPLAARTRRMQGVCPDINLIDVRVFREDGASDEFELLAAVQFLRWMNARAGHMAVHGANLSLSLIHQVRQFACGQTPICEECNEAVALGMVIVAAAGNRGFQAADLDRLTTADGFRDATITDPGNADNVITVGATHRKRPHEYGVSYFSSRGPTGDGRLKPDLVAPGEKIKGPTPDHGAEFKDGTSMAAPHVSGAAAMLMARHSELIGRPDRIKKILCESATDLKRERYFQGCGLVDILRALQSI